MTELLSDGVLASFLAALTDFLTEATHVRETLFKPIRGSHLSQWGKNQPALGDSGCSCLMLKIGRRKLKARIRTDYNLKGSSLDTHFH